MRYYHIPIPEFQPQFIVVVVKEWMHNHGTQYSMLCIIYRRPNLKYIIFVEQKMSYYKYRNSHYVDKTVLRHDGISYTGKTIYLHLTKTQSPKGNKRHTGETLRAL